MLRRTTIPLLLSWLLLGPGCDDEDTNNPGDAGSDAADAGAEPDGTSDGGEEPDADAGDDADGGLDAESDGDATSDADAGPDWTAGSLCQALSERICAGLSGCECRFDVRPYDEAGCVAARTAACQASFGARIEPDLAAGRVRIDDATVSACLDGIDVLADACALAHAGESPLPAACDRMVLATAGEGADCEIAGLAFCADGAGICAPGESGSTCTLLPGDGDDCLGGFCGVGLVCHPAGEGASACGPPSGADEPCAFDGECATGLICTPDGACAGPGDDGADCQDNLDCAAGLRCEAGSCAEAVAVGEGCRQPSVCGSGASCGRAPETRTCAEPHEAGDDCERGSCAEGLVCDSSSEQCVALPGEDDPCVDGNVCGPGLTCAFSTTTCVALPGEGEACFSDGEAFCAPGFGCRESDQTCQPAASATDGEPCLLNPPNYVCAEGLGCDFGAEGSICAALGGEDAPCNTDRTCQADFYCEFSTQTCTARLPDGSPCAAGNECLVGSECQIRAGEASCGPTPGDGDPCFETCGDGSTCQGPGGLCVPELCTLP